jgi:hypothetical protein
MKYVCFWLLLAGCLLMRWPTCAWHGSCTVHTCRFLNPNLYVYFWLLLQGCLLMRWLTCAWRGSCTVHTCRFLTLTPLCLLPAAAARLPADALADLCVARQLYSASHARIKQQRQALLQQLQAVMAAYSSMAQYGSDDALSNALGEWRHQGVPILCFWLRITLIRV